MTGFACQEEISRIISRLGVDAGMGHRRGGLGGREYDYILSTFLISPPYSYLLSPS